MIRAQLNKNILNFELISHDKNYSKFNISHHLRSKNLWNRLKKNPHLSEAVKGFLAIPRSCPNFPKKINFDFIEFSMTKLFDI